MLLASTSVLPSWPARMSHYGECDVGAEGAGKASGPQQLTGGAHDSGPAAALIGVSTRHTRRILAAYGEEGAHGNRSAATCSDPYLDTNNTHLSELPREREGIDIGRTTLRHILVAAGLKSPGRRQRMPHEGMLIQVDGSHHRWLGDDGTQVTLLLAVDDATGIVVTALFGEQENTHDYFLLMKGLIQRYGVPIALYTDRHSVFKNVPGAGHAGAPTQFSCAMDEFGIRMVFALPPQAKGRVERTAGTLSGQVGDRAQTRGCNHH